ncbi:MAG: type II toxin-antitoxin system RelE/ParE family toxin [Alphaproteobacteria bacterium]
MGTVYRSPAARRDLIAHYAYLTQNVTDEVAGRFLAQAEASFRELADQPMIGVTLMLTHPALSGIRKWRIKFFNNYLIFYQPRPNGINIVRVLHAAQDWWSLLGFESSGIQK